MSNPTEKQRFEQAIEEAQSAFFEKLAEAYPEIKTGDLPVDASAAFDNACNHVGNAWLEANQMCGLDGEGALSSTKTPKKTSFSPS